MPIQRKTVRKEAKDHLDESFSVRLLELDTIWAVQYTHAVYWDFDGPQTREDWEFFNSLEEAEAFFRYIWENGTRLV